MLRPADICSIAGLSLTLQGKPEQSHLRHSQIYILIIIALLCAAGAIASNVGREISSNALVVQLPDSTNLQLPDSANLSAATDTTTPSAPDSIARRRAPIRSGANPSTDNATDSLFHRTLLEPDSTPKTQPSHAQPSRGKIRRVKTDIDNVVDITANDSMVIQGRNNAFLYGASSVVYGEQQIDADEIRINMVNNTVYAIGRPDTAGEIQGNPVFQDGGTSYEAKTMEYNFSTEKGIITDIITEQGEGYLTGGRAKKIDDNTFFLQDGKYTTCDNHDHPHFYFQLTKAKVKPKKDIVVGPAYLVVADLPLPLAVPFGYFPFSEKYSSGFIFPTFGDDYNRGFYLSNGGYYFAINDNIDLALTGEIYTKGSWGINAQSAYVRRYKYSGSFNLSYLKTVTGDKGAPDYSSMTNFQVLWSHSQDAKANPAMTFSASVNFTTSGYSRNALDSYYSSSFTENTKSSTVNMTYRRPGSKWSFSTTANISQRTQDSTLTVSFPNVTVSMSQVQPFKRRVAVGAEKWYEKIKLSYSGVFNNSLTAQQNQFFKKSLIKDWRNGMRHNIPISATFNALNYINITPSIQITDRMYTSKIRRQWDPNAATEVTDTSYSFYNVWDFSTSLSLDTKIYGFFQPLPFLGDKVKMIRHVLTPTVSFSYNPDFSAPFFGYYGEYERPDAQGNLIRQKYSMFPNSLFGVPGQGKSGTVSFSLANNLEMKVKDNNDSIGERKISLIENLQISQSYNFAADSLRWSNINTSLLLKLMKNFNLNLAAVWDVYTYGLNSSGNPVRLNRTRLQAGKGLARLSSTGTSFSYSLNNNTFKRKSKDEEKDNTAVPGTKDPNDPLANAPNAGRDPRGNVDNDIDMGSNGYMKWEVPWNLTFNYSISYGYGQFNPKKMEYDGRINQNLSISGNIRPTANWNFSFSASYDFDQHKIAYMNCNISRDLHCFTMRASFLPVGSYKSFNFHISVNSSLLSDVKYEKRSSASNGVTWY